jgi:hypothetical protein
MHGANVGCEWLVPMTICNGQWAANLVGTGWGERERGA